MFDLPFFRSPNLIWLGVVALAPIIIHLAARSRPKPTPFPALRFILASHRRSSAKFKLKQLLLLLLRCLALLFFAFLVARPWQKGESADVTRAKATVTAVILLDTSYSMAYQHDGGDSNDKAPSLERAKKMAQAAIDAFVQGESRVCLLFVNETPQAVISDFNHAYDLASLKKRIGDAPVSYRGTDCTAALKEAARMLRGTEGVGKSIFLFTDMTEQSWPGAAPAGDDDDDISIYIGDVGAEKPLNSAVLGVKAPDSAAAGAPFEARARVDAVGASGTQVELTVDGQRRDRKPASAHRVAEIPLLGTATLERSEHWGSVELSGRDDLAADNAYHFSFRSKPAVKVVLVNGAPSREVRKDELFYLSSALAPSGVGVGSVVQVSELRPAALENGPLVDADVLVLCNVSGLSTGAWTKVRNYVSSGHGLIVFPGDRVDIASYNTVAQGDAPLLPCKMESVVTPPKPVNIEPGNLKHPVLREFQGGRNGDLAAAEFSTYVKLKPSARAASEVILAFKNDDPALAYGRYGAGNVMMFASTCDADWNTLPKIAVPYLVLMHESIKMMVSSRQDSRDIAVGTSAVMRVSAPTAVRAITMARVPDGKAEKVELTRLDARSSILQLPAVTEPGVYRVTVERAGGAKDEKFFAANLDTTESNMTRLAGGDDAIKALVPGFSKVVIARTPSEMLDQIARSERALELSSHIAGIMLAILLVEMFLSNRMRDRVDRDVEAPEGS
jgi:aerotolerance regulator-like protein/VWA domain-containing protein